MKAGLVDGLRDVLPYLRHFRGRTFVLKIGGEAIESDSLLQNFASQVAVLHQLGIRVVIVHGGGIGATELASELGIETSFIEGRRVTSREMMEVILMSLRGVAQAKLLSALIASGTSPVGLSGLDAHIAVVEKKPAVETINSGLVDYGFVGRLEAIKPDLIENMLEHGLVPVLCPVSSDAQGQCLNVNADDFACAVAIALKADKLIVLTSPRGLLKDLGDPLSLCSQVSAEEIGAMIKDGTIQGGMLPKVTSAIRALEHGVKQVHMVSFQLPDAVLTEVFTNEGCGTMILP